MAWARMFMNSVPVTWGEMRRVTAPPQPNRATSVARPGRADLHSRVQSCEGSAMARSCSSAPATCAARPRQRWFFSQGSCATAPKCLDRHLGRDVYGAAGHPPGARAGGKGLRPRRRSRCTTPRRIERADIEGADLIVGMARQHVREVVLADTPSFTKVFTLREIVRRGEQKGKRDGGESLEDWLYRISWGRRHLDLVGDSPMDDISDPMGGTPAQFRQMLTDVQALTRSLYLLIWP